MGICIKCGHETENMYSFQVGQKIFGTEYSYNASTISSPGARVEGHEYRVIDTIRKHACSRCIYADSIIPIIFIVALFIFLLYVSNLVIMEFIEAYTNTDKDITGYIIGIVITALPAIFLFYTLVRSAICVIKDTRIFPGNRFVGSEFIFKQCWDEIKDRYPGCSVYNLGD